MDGPLVIPSSKKKHLTNTENFFEIFVFSLWSYRDIGIISKIKPLSFSAWQFITKTNCYCEKNTESECQALKLGIVSFTRRFRKNKHSKIFLVIVNYLKKSWLEHSVSL